MSLRQKFAQVTRSTNGIVVGTARELFGARPQMMLSDLHNAVSLEINRYRFLYKSAIHHSNSFTVSLVRRGVTAGYYDLSVIIYLRKKVINRRTSAGVSRIGSNTSIQEMVARVDSSASGAAKRGVCTLSKAGAIELFDAGITVKATSLGLPLTPPVKAQLGEPIMLDCKRLDLVEQVLLGQKLPSSALRYPQAVGALTAFLANPSARAETCIATSIGGLVAQ